jgi:hypothetical protein
MTRNLLAPTSRCSGGPSRESHEHASLDKQSQNPPVYPSGCLITTSLYREPSSFLANHLAGSSASRQSAHANLAHGSGCARLETPTQSLHEPQSSSLQGPSNLVDVSHYHLRHAPSLQAILFHSISPPSKDDGRRYGRRTTGTTPRVDSSS